MHSIGIREWDRPAVAALEAVVCELCGAIGTGAVVFQASRLVLRCSRCNLVFSLPDDRYSASWAYSETYFKEGVYADYLGDQIPIGLTASRRLSDLSSLTDGRSMLEVGSAAGYFLVAARRAGWDVRGLELSPYMSAYSRSTFQIEVSTGSIEGALPFEVSSADVVALWDTIEHLSHPMKALLNIRNILAPYGVLALSTGDHGSLLRRLTGPKWRLFKDPTHNFFFDEATLRSLLTLAGFEIVEISRRGKWVSSSMILHQCGLPFSARIRKALQSAGWNPPIYVNLRDVMTVYARVSDVR